MIGGIVSSFTTFIALRTNALQKYWQLDEW